MWCKANQQQKRWLLIAHLRSSYQPFLRQYLNLLDPSQDPTCFTATSKFKISFTGSANVLLQWPYNKECLGTTTGPQSGLPLNLEIWWCLQGRPWSTLMPNLITSKWLTCKHTNTHTQKLLLIFIEEYKYWRIQSK